MFRFNALAQGARDQPNQSVYQGFGGAPFDFLSKCTASSSRLKYFVQQTFLLLGIMMFAGHLKAQVYLLDGSNTNLTFNTCSGTFYDSGGANGNYGNNQNYTITFCSSSSDPIVIDFDFINIENGWDYLYVYNGPGTGSPQFAGSPFSGSSAPSFTSAPGGCITFQFTSDGSVTYSGWAANISCGEGSSNYNNPGGTISTCSGNFYDTGGSFGNYGNNQNITTTFCSSESGQCVNIDFTSFSLENNWDFLYVYDGPSTASPLIGQYTGGNSPGNLTGSGGCLTFRFTSDGSVTFPGWAAAISCSDCDAEPPGDGNPPACPSIDVGPDQELDCATACTQLEADVTETGLTTSYEVSSVPYEPPHPFTGGTPLFIGIDDIYSGIINLPFNFCFYGNMYSQAVVGANGLVSFNTGYANQFCPWAFNQAVPNAALPINAIFGAYHDIDPSQGGEINYAILGEAPCRTFVVNFNQIPHFQCDCNFFSSCRISTQQIVIYETTNIIDVYIEQKETCNGWNGGRAVIGIQNATGANGITPPGRNTGVWDASNEGWRFTPSGPPNYVINWYDDQNTLIGNGPSIDVCPQETTTYTGEVIYQHCDGSTVIETDEVTVEIADSFTLNEAVVDESCPGACDGSIEITTNDGLPPFTFDIGNGVQPTGVFNDLCAGDHSITVIDANDCISVAQITIEAPPTPNPGEDSQIELCANDATISLGGELGGVPDAGGNWTDPQGLSHSGNLNPATDASGDYTYTVGFPECEFSAVVSVIIHPVQETIIEETICAGESVILPDGTEVTTAGAYDVVLPSIVTGCDSTITTNVVVNPLLFSTEDYTICEGESVVLPDGTEVSQEGSYEVTLQSAVTGCDSTITTAVIVNPLLTSEEEFTICEDEFVTLPDGTEVYTAGSYDVTLQSLVTGCDSTITTTVIVNPLLTSEQEFTICEDEFITLPDGSEVNTAGSYDVTLPSVITGCDSTITTTVIVNPLLTSEQEFTICEDEFVTLPDGSEVNTAGSYDVTLQSVVTGCDSTITTSVIVNPLLTSEQGFTICEDEFVTLPDGSEVNTAGSYDVTLESAVTGCDSTITTTVIVNPLLTSEQEFTICEDEFVTLPDGSEVYTAGSYDVTLQSVVTGCDSTITTTVIFNPLLTSEQEFTICEDEFVTLPDGSEVNTAGSYDVTLQSVVTGCDSTITTTVIVNPLLFSEQEFTICEDEFVTLPDGSEVNTAGSYDVTLQSVVTGCDSTITTTVIVNPLLFSEQEFTICEDEFVTLPDGTEVNTAGNYDVTLQSVVTGCDSTITTTVIVNPLLTSEQEFTICEDESVTLPDGSEVNTAGSYDVTLQSVITGCDSTITTTVIVNPLLTSEQEFTICENEFVTLPDGSEVNTAGSYDVTLQSAVTGCDSTIATTVIVNPLLTSEQDFTICEDEFVTLPDGTEVNTAGSYDVTLQSAVTGCDSTITTTVIVNPLLTSEQEFTICEDEFVTLPDGTEVNTAGSYDVTLQSAVTGCDSTITTTVIVNPLLTSEQEFTICEDEFATLPDGSEVNTAGSYDVTLQSVNTGCDSTITTTVIVNPLLFSEQEFTICEAEFVTLPDGTEVNTAGSYDVTLQSAVTGCDSTITTSVTVVGLIAVSNLTEECESTGVTYTISFEISGGDSDSYAVSGIDGNISPGSPAVFTSNPIPEGTSYDITVSDANACNPINLTGTVSCNCPAAAQLSGGATICEGESADLTFTFTGESPYSVTYSDGTSNFIINGLDSPHTINVAPTATTNFSLISMSDTNCDGNTSGTATIVVNTIPDAGEDGNISLCENDSPTNLFAALQGNPDADGSWTDPQGNPFDNPFDPTIHNAGIYTYTVVGAAPCPSVSSTVSVELLEVVAVSTLLEECEAGGATYIVSFEIAGGDPTSYSVTGNNGTITPGNPAVFVSDPISSGQSYSFEVSDGNSCNTIQLSGNVACDCPVTASISGDNDICLGSLSELTFTLEGTGPFDVVYSDGTDNFTLTGILNGHTVSVTPDETTTFTLISVADQFCPGTVSGSATVNVTLPPFAGNDATLELCADEVPLSLFELLGGNPTAGGSWMDPDGNDFSGTLDPGVDLSGTYTYTVLGGLCPDDAAEVEVVIYALPQASILGDASICDGILANLGVDLEGSGSWTVVYAIDGVEQPPIETTDENFIIETGEEGTYTIISVEDEHCAGSGSGAGLVEINESPTANISGQGAICPGDEADLQIDLTGEGDWTVIYTIDGVEQDPLVISDNNFILTSGEEGVFEIMSVVDANCPGTPSGSAEIEWLDYPEASISGGGVICPSQSAEVEIELSGQGDITVTYLENGELQTLTASAGTVVLDISESTDFELVSVSDAFCSGIVDGTASVQVLDLPTAAISGGGVICTGESTDIEFDFEGTAPFILTYTLNGVEQELVSNDYSASITVDDNAEFELVGISDATCDNAANGSAVVAINALPTGVMSGGGVLCAGEEGEIQIDFTGSGNWTFVITHNGETENPINTNISPYTINTGTDGLYELISVEDDNCVGIAEGSADIDVNDLPTATLSGEGSICAGQPTSLQLELTGAGPWTVGYAIDGVQQPPLVVNSSPYNLLTGTVGDYTLLSVADAHCIGTVAGSGTVNENPLPTANISGNALICPTESAAFDIVLSGTAPWTVVYSINGVQQPPVIIDSSPFELPANTVGSYVINSVTDAHCSNSGSGIAVLEYAPYPTATLTGGGTFCPGEMGNVAIVFTGIGPWTFEYAIDGEVFGPITTPSNTYTLFDDISGTYTLVSVSDANCGGTFEGEAEVFFNSPVQAQISPGGGVCPGELFQLNASATGGVPPYSFQWFNEDNDSWVQFDDSVSVAPYSDMNIYVVATDQCGSVAYSDTVLVYPHQTPLASFDFSPRHNITVMNTTVHYDSESSLFAHSMYWEFYELTEHHGWELIGTSHEANPTFTYPDDNPGEYQACLYVQTIDGCEHKMCLPLEILGEFIIYVPNAFTPNEDGINDLFGPVMEGIDPSSYEFFVVNRWGETVFYTNDIDQKWNGSGMNGTHYAPDGVYSWKIKVRQLNASDAEEFSGHVTLIR